MSESKLQFVEGKEVRIQGFPICPGIAVGKPFFFTVIDELVPEFSVPDSKIDQEIDRYYKALKSSRNDLLSLQERLQREGGGEAVAILGSHLEIIRDPVMTDRIVKEIRDKGKNTEYVFTLVIGEYEEKFQKITDQFFQERLKDFKDISRRIISHLRKHERYTLSDLRTSSIVFAHELAPSDTAEANTDYIQAFVTRSGAETSHVAIMARAKGIPFVSSVDFPDFSIARPPQVIVDGGTGEVIINPTKRSLASYQQKQQKLKSHVKGLQKSSVLEAETFDGYKVHLSTNIEMRAELDALAENGSAGIGLFRSEYLFLSQDSFPTEEEQFVIYKYVVEKVDGQSAVIRTFDIGGDKFGNLHPTRYEKNPYLGCRATRLMLKEPTIFKAQLRAILRASAFGEVSLLFPMISGVAELRAAKAIVEEVKKELEAESVPFDHDIAIGCMIEVPSAAITADIIASECHFLSIGTNDLVQYALAVDRTNPAMSYLYTPTDPSIIRMIKMVVEAGNAAQKPVSVCGEIAADPHFTALLLGLGVHELSVALPSLPVIKNVIRHLSIVEATEFAEEVLSLSTAEEVQKALKKNYDKLLLETP